MHWTAGFDLCYILNATGPPPVMSIVRPHRTRTVNRNDSSLLRDVVGFVVGGLAAAVAAALIFLAFFPLPEPKPTDHTREALGVLVLVVFFSGGFIGRRPFRAVFWSDLFP